MSFLHRGHPSRLHATCRSRHLSFACFHFYKCSMFGVYTSLGVGWGAGEGAICLWCCYSIGSDDIKRPQKKCHRIKMMRPNLPPGTSLKKQRLQRESTRCERLQTSACGAAWKEGGAAFHTLGETDGGVKLHQLGKSKWQHMWRCVWLGSHWDLLDTSRLSGFLPGKVSKTKVMLLKRR